MKLLWGALCLLAVVGLAACAVREAASDGATRTRAEVVTSPGGVTAWLLHDPTHPVVALEVTFIGGSAEDPPGLEGGAEALADMIQRGAGPYDEAAFEARLDDLRMGIQAGADEGRVALSVRMLSEDRDAAFEMVRLALHAPRFDPDALTRYRQQVQAALKQRETNPGWIASQTLKQATMPAHPLSRAASADSIAALDAAALQDLRTRLLSRDRLQIVVTGDITAAQLAPLLDQTFAGLPAGGTRPPVPALRPDGQNQILVRALPQPQSLFSLLAPGPDLSDADFFPTLVALELLGGDGLGSRLNQRLRTDLGLTYGVGLSMDLSPHGTLITGGGLTQNATAGQALEALRRELQRFAATGPTAEELADIKSYMTGSFVLDFDSSFALAGRLSYYRYLGRAADYIHTRNTLVTAVTAEQVQGAAQRWLQPQHFAVAVVGVPAGVQANAPFAR